MKSKIATIVFLAATLQPVYADAVVEELLLRRQGSNVNVRVNLSNPATTVQKGPVVVELSVRADENSPWTAIKSWDDIDNIKPGNKISRDFFDENNAFLRNLAAQGRFQARATVRAPGISDTVEKTSWYDQESDE